MSKDGQRAGKIIYESHRTTSWKNEFVDNLKSQQTKFEADYAILVTTKFPADMKDGNFGFKSGVWICKFQDLPRLEKVLRHFILKIHSIKKPDGNHSEKSLQLYNFIQSGDFRKFTDRALEKSTEMLADINKEEKHMTNFWNNQRKNIAAIEKEINDLTDKIDEKMLNPGNSNGNGSANSLNVDEDDEESGIMSLA